MKFRDNRLLVYALFGACRVAITVWVGSQAGGAYLKNTPFLFESKQEPLPISKNIHSLVPVNTSIGFHLPRHSVQVQSHWYQSYLSLNPVLIRSRIPVRRARRRQKETPLKEVRSEALLLTKRKSSPRILWDYPFLIDSKKEGDVKPESLLSQRPSLYSIGGVVSMHPTVLSCSPMKDR